MQELYVILVAWNILFEKLRKVGSLEICLLQIDASLGIPLPVVKLQGAI